MKAKHAISILTFTVLIGLVLIFNISTSSAESEDVRIIQISPTGEGRAYTVVYSPDGNELVVGTSLGIIYYDATTLETIQFTPTENLVRSLNFSVDGKTIASGSYDNIVRLWRTSDGSLVSELKGHSGWVRSLMFSPDDNLLATASDDNTVRLWNVNAGNLNYSINQGVDGVRTLAFSPDGRILATGGFDNIIRLWQVSDGSLLRELKGHSDWVRALAFSPDGKLLASGAFDNTVRLWNVVDGEILVTRGEHASSVLGLAFSPDGKLLASASVDQTVRLWTIPSLEPFDLLKGHNDFVFSVAFSPDGRNLASGAVDNTVRVWQVPLQETSAALEFVTSPTSCKSCHHPRGLQGPPRVIEPACSVCHDEGARASNWCASISRNPGPTTMKVQLQSPEFPGFFHPTSSASVIINSPGNGEVIYGESNISYLLQVKGQVYYPGDISDIKLSLEISAEDGTTSVVETTPSEGGAYTFLLEGNHGAVQPISLLRNGISIAGEAPCLVCHKESIDYQGTLPKQGRALLRVILSTSEGIQATDERIVFVDSGGVATIPVQIKDTNGNQVIGLAVKANTRLYEWRGRSFNGISDLNGKVLLQVEALSQNPTTYEVFVPPTIIDGISYESKETISVLLSPGATITPTVTLEIETTSGEISGYIPAVAESVQVLAISIPDGAAHASPTSSDGKFAFSGLPLGQYLVSANPQILAGQNLVSNNILVDLSSSIYMNVEMKSHALEGTTLIGKSLNEKGEVLPFAWIRVNGQTRQVDPASGSYIDYELPEGKFTAIMDAPGYYSKTAVIDGSPTTENRADFQLNIRPDTRIIPWGNGEIIIPSETVFSEDGKNINLEQGWLWGNGKADDPITVRSGGILITIAAGKFALEQLPGYGGWLYVLDGQANVSGAGSYVLIPVETGEMVYLDNEHNINPVPYNLDVIRALQLGKVVPVESKWQPSLGAQIRNKLAGIGIGTAQLMTYITYLLEVIALLAILFFTVKWVIQNIKEHNLD